MYYSGLLLVLFFNYILRIRFVLATATGWCIILCYYLSVLLYPGVDTKVLWTNLFFLAGINFIGMLASYSIDFFMRKNYIFSLELNNQRQSVMEINKSLEQRVREKTIALQQDIERRKRIEKDLISAKEKAEESERLKTAFLNNMSHEVRTPMNGILGFADMLDLVDPQSPKFKKYLSILKISANRLMNTVDDLIAISKVQTGQLDVVFSHFKLTELLEELIKIHKEDALKRNISLNYHHCTENDIILFTDKQKINFIITSFIKNAITFTDRGSIDISCYYSNNNVVSIDVKDTGIGIPKARQNAIFNKFEKADVKDIKAHQGTGLGLPLSLAYAQKLNAKIVVDSQLGKGSTFSLKLPLSSLQEK